MRNFEYTQTPLLSYQCRQAEATPEEVLNWLKEGNERFAKAHAIHGGFAADARNRVAVSAVSQRPLAVILSCIDSRTAPEVVFDATVGDLFTVRVGANVVNDDILGSLEIAAESGAKVLLVLGHTDCGGVKGACSDLHFGHMTQLLERVKPAVQAAHSFLDAHPVLAADIGPRIVGNRRFIAQVSRMNAEQSRRQILERSPILRAKVEAGELTVVAALYDVETGEVRF
jgi:carbonic anhydrase